jgi:hypothetical protein
MSRLRTTVLLITCCVLVISVTAAPSHARRRRGPVLIAIPARIPRTRLDRDPTGEVSTFQPSGAIRTKDSPYFQTLGQDQRT